MSARSVWASPGKAASKRCGFCPEYVNRALREGRESRHPRFPWECCHGSSTLKKNAEGPESSGLQAWKPKLKALNESRRSPVSFLILSLIRKVGRRLGFCPHISKSRLEAPVSLGFDGPKTSRRFGSSVRNYAILKEKPHTSV